MLVIVVLDVVLLSWSCISLPQTVNTLPQHDSSSHYYRLHRTSHHTAHCHRIYSPFSLNPVPACLRRGAVSWIDLTLALGARCIFYFHLSSVACYRVALSLKSVSATPHHITSHHTYSTVRDSMSQHSRQRSVSRVAACLPGRGALSGRPAAARSSIPSHRLPSLPVSLCGSGHSVCLHGLTVRCAWMGAVR